MNQKSTPTQFTLWAGPIMLVLILLTSCNSNEREFTRGIGIYPGNPAEDFSPELFPDRASYRNLALRRPAYHSSHQDYNLTAQLVTDGIVAKEIPAFISLKTNQGVVPKNVREWVLDHVTGSVVSFEGSEAWIEFVIRGGGKIAEITSISINGRVTYDEEKPEGYDFKISGSMDGSNWEILDADSGPGLPGITRPPFTRRRPQTDSTGRSIDFFADFMGPRDLNAPSAITWSVGDFDFFRDRVQVEMVPSHQFSSAWMSAGTGEEWVYVDLGSPSCFDRIKLHWLQKASAEGNISDKTKFKSGVREMSFKVIERVLSIYINGRRFIGRGGNWVGQTGDDEFYEACDRHGIMVWQDFWLANPVDGPNPYDPEMFMDNAKDMIKRIRNHPSIAIYVGRNEGNPPEVLDTALRAIIPKIHPGIDYISNSSSGVVSGGGPYRALPVEDYFLLYGRHRLHSERGMPNVMTFESLQQTLPLQKLWPQNSQWGLHDYCLEGAQGAASFNEIIEKGFSPVDNAKKFTELAQWVNYNAGDIAGLTARAQLINMDGSVQWEKESKLDSNEDTTEKLFNLEFSDSLSSTHFVKLTLSKGEQLISENFYWRGLEEGNYQALNELPETEIDSRTTMKRNVDQWIIETVLNNTSDLPALMIRLKAAGSKSGERILPALYSDNYISLMPGESGSIVMRVKLEDCRGEKPQVEITGFNVI